MTKVAESGALRPVYSHIVREPRKIKFHDSTNRVPTRRIKAEARESELRASLYVALEFDERFAKVAITMHRER